MTKQEARQRELQSERDRLLGLRRLTYTVPETAVILGIGINQAYEWARAGTFVRRRGKRPSRPARAWRSCSPVRPGDMRGADLETTRTLLEHMRRRLATIGREMGGAADDDERLWWWAADLAALGGDVEVLIDRERFPTNVTPVASERVTSTETEQH